MTPMPFELRKPIEDAFRDLVPGGQEARKAYDIGLFRAKAWTWFYRQSWTFEGRSYR